MFRFVAASALALATVTANAQSAPPAIQVLPGDIKYAPLPFAQGVEAAWLAGGPAAEGAYTVRVRILPDAKIPPHTHPDTRQVTVLSGELFAGFGTTFDANAVKGYAAGSFFTVPAGVAHFVWAKNGEAVYQESGNGPSPTALVK
jgi:quercetin dioxygenase-like cupin family protein